MISFWTIKSSLALLDCIVHILWQVVIAWFRIYPIIDRLEWAAWCRDQDHCGYSSLCHRSEGERTPHILCCSTGTGMVNCSGRWVKTNKRINNDNNSYQSCQLVAHCLQTIAQWCWWLVWGCRVDVQSSALSCLSLRPLSATDNNLSPSSKNYFINFIKKYSAPSLLVTVVNATRRM